MPTPPLALGATGAAVRDLHASLRKLGYTIPENELTAQTFGGFDHFQIYRRRQFDLDRFALGVENLNAQVFDEIVFGIAEQIFLKINRFIRLRVHEMVTAVVLVTELDLFSIDIDQLDLVGRTKTDIGAFAGVDVTNDRLDKGA